MSNPTSNFGWQMPTPTDLVTDLPADFEVFGQAVDSDFVDLLGGTTGQVLSKTSNTDLDFTWIAANAGDITGVTAGTGISGGGTSGTVTVTNDMATTITASGDIVVGTGSGTYDNLPIGTTGQILTADTTVSPYKVKWATPAGGGGKVLQVVNMVYNAEVFNATNTLTATGITLAITPSLTSSKVLVLLNQNGIYKSAGDPNNGLHLELFRDATSLYQVGRYSSFTGTSIDMVGTTLGMCYLDSPATTSSITYSTKFSNRHNASTVAVQRELATSSITLLEIGA